MNIHEYQAKQVLKGFGAPVAELVDGLTKLDLSGTPLLPGGGKARNVLIVTLEGIPGAYIAKNRQLIGSPYAEDLMPRLSQWAERSMTTPDYVLHSHQTIRGLYSMLCGDYSKLDSGTPKGVELSQMGYPAAPEALEAVIRTVASHTKKPIYVTENGVATEDDSRRVAFIDKAVAGTLNCLRDGIDVRGYIHWSLLDNWEWFSGYGPKFGLVAVDRATFARTPKPSARHMGAIARKGLPAGLKSR